MGWLGAAVSIGSTLLGASAQASAERAQGRANARNLRQQAEDAKYNAELDAKEVEREARSIRETNIESIIGGEASGIQSFQKGTGISSLLETNKAKAIANAKEILSEGSRRYRRIQKSASNAESAGDEAGFNSLLSGGLSAIGKGIELYDKNRTTPKE